MSKKIAQYLVIALSVHSDLTQRVYNAGEVVGEDAFPDGHVEKLVAGKFIEPYEGKTEELEPAGTPYIVTAADVERLPGMDLQEGQEIHFPHEELVLVDADSQATNEDGAATHNGGKVLALVGEIKDPQPTTNQALTSGEEGTVSGTTITGAKVTIETGNATGSNLLEQTKNKTGRGKKD